MFFCPNGKEGERQEFPAGRDSEEEVYKHISGVLHQKKSRSGMLHLTI